MNNKDVFFNASEHVFNLGLSETLMLRNYARIHGFKFCTMIGGAESIRDIYEARDLDPEAFEFTFIESSFALNKIFSAIEQVFLDRLEIFKYAKIFINISTPSGMDMISDMARMILPEFLLKTNLVFNLDRRSIAGIYNKCKNLDFEYLDFEDQINPIIYEKLIYLNNLGFPTSLSGGMTIDSVKRIANNKILPDYLKTGLFTIPFDLTSKIDFFKNITTYQTIETKMLGLMKDSLFVRYDYIDKRQKHLFNYLID